MIFSGEDDEEDFTGFNSISDGGTKLASLFEADQFGDVSKPDVNPTLVYRPPKQPSVAAKKTTGTSSKAANSGNTSGQQPAMSVIHAVVVHAYKFDGGSHVSLGKLGVAVVGQHDKHLYRLLLYRDKQQAITTANIASSFAYTVQSNNYASFYDDKQESWSIMFDTDQAAIECAKQVGLARANSCQPPLQLVLWQDLTFGKGAVVTTNETIAIKYTVYLLSNGTLGSVIDEKITFVKIKLGTSDCIKGINAGLLGALRGSMRMVFIPLSQTEHVANSNIPSNSLLVYVIQMDEESIVADDCLSDDCNKKEPVSTSITSGDESTVRARCASISEQLQTNPETDKAKIISRMAKMGQPMLPIQGALLARGTKTRSSFVSSESEDEASIRAVASHSSVSPEPVVPPRPRMRNQQNSNSKRSGTQQPVPTNAIIQQMPMTYGMTTQQQQQQQQQQLLTLGTTGVNPYMMYPNHGYVGSPGDSHVPVLLSEMRSQTTELRLQMGNVSEKVDRVLGQLEKSNQQIIYPTVEVGTLTQNIQRIVSENEDLRAELKEKNQKLEGQTTTITELLQRNQKFLEQSNSMWEQRSTYLESSTLTSQVKISLERELQQAQSDLTQLKTQLTTALEQNKILQAQLLDTEKFTTNSDEVCQMKNALSVTNQELISMGERIVGLESERDKLLDELINVKQEISVFNMERSESMELKAKCQDLEMKLEAVSAAGVKTSEASSSLSNLSDEIKKIMNAVYKNLNKNFEADLSYGGGEIRKILGSTIREITLSLMDHLEKGNESKLADINNRQKEPDDIARINEPAETKKRAELQSVEVAESQNWKPEPPPFLEGSNEEEEENDWLS